MAIPFNIALPLQKLLIWPLTTSADRDPISSSLAGENVVLHMPGKLGYIRLAVSTPTVVHLPEDDDVYMPRAPKNSGVVKGGSVKGSGGYVKK